MNGVRVLEQVLCIRLYKKTKRNQAQLIVIAMNSFINMLLRNGGNVGRGRLALRLRRSDFWNTLIDTRLSE